MRSGQTTDAGGIGNEPPRITWTLMAWAFLAQPHALQSSQFSQHLHLAAFVAAWQHGVLSQASAGRPTTALGQAVTGHTGQAFGPDGGK